MHKGYRIVAYNVAGGVAYTLQNHLPVDLEIGAQWSPGEYFLATDQTLVEHYTGLSDDEDLLLTYEFTDDDIIRGEVAESCSEILVRTAKLVGASFHDKQAQVKYGHLLIDQGNKKMCAHEDASQTTRLNDSWIEDLSP